MLLSNYEDSYVGLLLNAIIFSTLTIIIAMSNTNVRSGRKQNASFFFTRVRVNFELTVSNKVTTTSLVKLGWSGPDTKHTANAISKICARRTS